ncbi:MAG TPA: hypothetical protein VFB60_06230 [Ktedonobacteraceae bacterium]|nr:hypothetical protein [Ktedonobacteraceae bacterium]
MASDIAPGPQQGLASRADTESWRTLVIRPLSVHVVIRKLTKSAVRQKASIPPVIPKRWITYGHYRIYLACYLDDGTRSNASKHIPITYIAYI